MESPHSGHRRHGHLGRQVVPRLREAGCEVRVLSRRGRDYQSQPQP
jgi:uncharacterized protein YbjT (DUF2867 family)